MKEDKFTALLVEATVCDDPQRRGALFEKAYEIAYGEKQKLAEKKQQQ